MTDNVEAEQLILLTVDIVSAYVASNQTPAGELPNLIDSVHRSLAGLISDEQEIETGAPTPAVSVKKSVHNDYIACLEDGKRFKLLKRHLDVHHGLTPEQYRNKWNLPASYPMAAPSYSATRSHVAKSMGLGHRKPNLRKQRK